MRGRRRSTPIRPLLRAALLGLILVGLAAFGRTCAEGVSDFFVSFGSEPAAGAGAEGREVRRLSDDEIRARFPSLLAPDAGGASRPDDAGHPGRRDAGRPPDR